MKEKIHDFVSLLPFLAKQSYSQEGEDVIFGRMSFLPKVGYYVDVGANHPVLYSNTYALYRKGWKGMCFEPIENREWMFALIRPRDVFLPWVVSFKASVIGFTQYSQTQINKVVAADYCNSKLMFPLSFFVGIKTPHIDIMNIDVEGHELQVLKGFPWHIQKPTVICVEDYALDLAFPKSKIHAFLTKKGYKLYARTASSSIYVSQKEKFK